MRLRLGLRRKGKDKSPNIDKKSLEEIVQQRLADYVRREDLQEYLENIERDKKKKQLWDSLPVNKKIKVLQYALKKKGEQHGKG